MESQEQGHTNDFGAPGLTGVLDSRVETYMETEVINKFLLNDSSSHQQYFLGILLFKRCSFFKHIKVTRSEFLKKYY